MGWVDGILSSGTFAKISLVLCFGQAFFNWVAFTTTYWGIIVDTTAIGDDTLVGIWRQCQKKTTTCYELDGYANVWFGCFQALSLLAFIGCNLSLLLILLFVFWDGCKRNKELGQAAAVTCILAALLWLIVVIMFGSKFYSDDDVSGTVFDNKRMGYSHTIAIFALLIEAIAGVILLIEALQSPVMKSTEGIHQMSVVSSLA